MIAVVTARLSGSEAITSPAGWTRVRRDSNIGGAALSQVLQYKVAGAFEPDSYTWTFSSSVGATGGITAWGGVDVSAPIVTHGGLYSANTRLIAAPSITTTVDGALVLSLYGNSSKSSMTAPSGMLEEYDVTTESSNNASTSESSSYAQTNRGPTGYKVATSSSSSRSTIGQSLALTPDSSATATATAAYRRLHRHLHRLRHHHRLLRRRHLHRRLRLRLRLRRHRLHRRRRDPPSGPSTPGTSASSGTSMP